MTYGEVKKAVAHLGVVENFDDAGMEAALNDAINRGLTQIARLIPTEKVYQISHYPIEPVSFDSCFRYFGQNIVKTVSDVAEFSFKHCGMAATVTVVCGERSQEILIKESQATNTYAYRISDFWSGAVERGDLVITFSGGGAYVITAFTAYNVKSIFGAVPYGDCIEYNLPLLTGDFLRLSAAPVLRGQTLVALNTGYFVLGEGVIGLPSSESGEYLVKYDHKPEYVNEDTEEDAEIDISAETEDLLPLLVGYYIWSDVDDKPAIAAACYARYQEQLSIILNKRRVKNSLPFRSVNSWDN